LDIKHLEYFTAIVENDCNLSATSKKIHVSQPTLSQMIKSFEEQENIRLFERTHGRLERLSSTGELFYNQALEVLKQHNYMMEQLRADASKIKGNITIGIPPLILSTLFAESLSKLILDNPDINIKVIELGAFELRKRLILQEMDIAILLATADLINPDDFERQTLVEDQLVAIMDKNNPLASEEVLEWSSLNKHPLAIFDDSFMIHHLCKAKFDKQKINPEIRITSGNWDYLLRSTIGSDLVSILPAPLIETFPHEQIKAMGFDSPLDWKVEVYRPKKRFYSRIEDYTFQSILKAFRRD